MQLTSISGGKMAADAPADTYPMPEHGWTCFHCGENFRTPGPARLHFGFDPSAEPACRIKTGAEMSILKALRGVERINVELQARLHAESADGLLAHQAAECRFQQAVIQAEELGYERGLRDGRTHLEMPGVRT
jgi:hypothetical protein